MLKNDLNGFGVCKGDEVSFSVTQSEKGARATDVKVKAALGKQEGAGAGGPLFFGEVRSFNQLKGRSPPPSAPREREERRESESYASEKRSWPQPRLWLPLESSDREPVWKGLLLHQDRLPPSTPPNQPRIRLLTLRGGLIRSLP